ncbi:DEAD/DEAH box helicase family protein [Eubacterium xylanophilum]|uniref:DEAD/DEAH box helicase family protein n=1 Tax=Eubacterium xylanophilum TaxID=39497 RepID=UPI0004791243|nr:DEAD/DEAH box helicase family protein [Eubacterium xylanophilum]
MFKSNSAENIDDKNLNIARTDVMTGDRDKRMYLYYQLIRSIKEAVQIDIVVSFLMESGVRMLLKELNNALNRGARVRILTGNYLGITQPSALYLIKHELGDRVELKFYNEKGRSFHPKSYIFHYQNHSEIYIGSSNVSRSALTSGIEWNYRFSSETDRLNYEKFYSTFEDLFENHSILIDDARLREYSKNWHRPAASKDLDKYDDIEINDDYNVIPFFEPRGAQIEALCALENTRLEGATKALVLAATGIGKTALAAFDSRKYDRILFVAHREEILKQAAKTFENIRGVRDYGFFNGDNKCSDKPVIFASVSTLGNERYLNEKYFKSDYFQYLVIDEIHHGVTDQYKRVVEYFDPEFMLGLTATPERMDGRSIYEICDYNVPYELPLKEAINKGMLVPFHYYGIYDDTTDYEGIHLVRGHFDENELNKRYIDNEKRYNLIYKYYCKYGSKRALGFCCSRAHAEDMARAFSQRGISSVAVYSNASGEYSRDRSEAIESLKNGDVRVIFSVDMFNEGVDITSVDMVLFLRPTESPVVFLQQLGRGLRRDRNKEYLNVLDFIGNYEKAGNVRYYITDGYNKNNKEYNPADHDQLPDDCIVDFDMRLIDLFHEMDKKKLKLRDRIKNEYYLVKEKVARRPLRMDLFTYMEEDVYQLSIEHSKDNPFKRYIDYLHELGELTEEEEVLYKSVGREFINLLETTNMTKVYKMPVLMAFYNQGNILMEVTEEQLLDSWKRFFSTGTNWRDLDKNMTYEKYLEVSDAEHIKKIIKMPVHFLQESGKGFFVPKEGCALALCEEMRAIINNESFAIHMKDVIEYRAMDYYKRRYNGAERI